MKLFVFAALLILCGGAHAQFQPLPEETTQAQSSSRQLSPHADQLAAILGIKSEVQRALALRSDRPAGTSMGLDELTLRQEISERAMAASFEADGVLAEISQEQARINEISTFLQGRRDKGVNVATLASLITGSGVGIAVNALQFSSSTANTGNGIGVGSGVASTILSLIGIHLQRGPARQIGSAPNMLAIPLGRKPVLYSDYPDDVLAYLNSVPPGETADRGTRLEQLMKEWTALGRLDPPKTSRREKEIDLMTSSLDPRRKLRIDDLGNRVIMLADVGARVSLMKRDLAELMRSLTR
jgi:hypothetical protein